MTEDQVTLQNRFHFNGLKDSKESAALTNSIHNLLLFFYGFCFLLCIWMDFRGRFRMLPVVPVFVVDERILHSRFIQQ